MGPWLVILVALLAASLEPVLAKIAYRSGATPWDLLYTKSVVAALLILPLTRRCVWLTGSQRMAVVQVALLLLCTNTCLLWAVQSLPAVTVITLLSTTPALVALVNQRRGRDQLTWRFWSGFSLCFGGVGLSLGAPQPGLAYDVAGLALVALALLSSTLYRTRLEDVTKVVSPLVVSTYIFWVHGLLCWLILPPPPTSTSTIGIWLGLAAAVANVAFLYSIRRVGATNMSLFNLLQRPLVVVLASWTLNETMTGWQWLGVVLVLAGIRQAQLPRA